MEPLNETIQGLRPHIALVAMLATLLLGIQFLPRSDLDRNVQASTGTEEVVPVSGIELPVVWGDFGKQLVELGAIDRKKFVALYANLSEGEKKLLDGDNPGRLRITRDNAPYLLNLFWALGLANRNPILEDDTEMMNPA